MGLDHHLHHAHSHWANTRISIIAHCDHQCCLDDIILLLRSHMGSHTVGTAMTAYLLPFLVEPNSFLLGLVLGFIMASVFWLVILLLRSL